MIHMIKRWSSIKNRYSYGTTIAKLLACNCFKFQLNIQFKFFIRFYVEALTFYFIVKSFNFFFSVGFVFFFSPLNVFVSEHLKKEVKTNDETHLKSITNNYDYVEWPQSKLSDRVREVIKMPVKNLLTTT